jgi:8-oxo-dGTP pyrophosphatase MutT (NUDIX family)
VAKDGGGARWQVHGERTVYTSPWVDVVLADVELPDGQRIPEHHVVRAPLQVAGCLVHDPETDSVLLIRRHRFIPGTWGWEVPAGRLDPGETPAAGAVRETEEETGWRATGEPRLLASFAPSPGLLDQVFHAFTASGAEHIGPPTDVHEAGAVRWVRASDVAELLDAGEVRDSMSLVALHTWLRERALAGDVVRAPVRETDPVLRAVLHEGRLRALPRRAGQRLVVLERAATLFEPGVRYPEREVDLRLKAFHVDPQSADHVSLRRYLIDAGLLSREAGTYWRTGGPVESVRPNG